MRKSNARSAMQNAQPCNLTRPEIAFFVSGMRGKEHHVLKLSKIRQGWAQRRIVGTDARLDVDYVSHETRDDLREWFLCDFSQGHTISNEVP